MSNSGQHQVILRRNIVSTPKFGIKLALKCFQDTAHHLIHVFVAERPVCAQAKSKGQALVAFTDVFALIESRIRILSSVDLLQHGGWLPAWGRPAE
jgi:hypothetical protein